MRRLLLGALGSLLAVLATACGDDGGQPDSTTAPDQLKAVIASSDLAVGPQRFTFVMLRGEELITQTSVFARFFKIPSSGAPQLVGQSPLPWTPLERGQTVDGGELEGIYYANLTFDVPGAWGLGVSLGNAYDEASEVRVQFDVKDKTATLFRGDKGVPYDTPTKADRPMDEIHTGSVDDPGFHDLSIADALGAGKPSVIVFATPAFCRTATCGPSLQVAIKAAATFSSQVNFLHIEPYEISSSGNVVTDSSGNFKLAAAGLAWRLPTEPWVFVLDKTGTVVGRFEGPYALEELTYVLTELTK